MSLTSLVLTSPSARCPNLTRTRAPYTAHRALYHPPSILHPHPIPLYPPPRPPPPAHPLPCTLIPSSAGARVPLDGRKLPLLFFLSLEHLYWWRQRRGGALPRGHARTRQHGSDGDLCQPGALPAAGSSRRLNTRAGHVFPAVPHTPRGCPKSLVCSLTGSYVPQSAASAA